MSEDIHPSTNARQPHLIVEALRVAATRKRVMSNPDAFLENLGFCTVGTTLGQVVAALYNLLGDDEFMTLSRTVGNLADRNPQLFDRFLDTVLRRI